MRKLAIIIISIIGVGLLVGVIGCGKASITILYPLPGEVNVAYSQTLDASGGSGTYTKWSITSGTLPNGLSLDASTGAISGIPTMAGISSLTVQVTDSKGETGSKDMPIDIYEAPSIITLSLLAGKVNIAYLQTVEAYGGSGTYTKWSITSGTLPNGLSLDASTGAISGTPTMAGTSSFTVQVTDSNGVTGNLNLSITIATAS